MARWDKPHAMEIYYVFTNSYRNFSASPERIVTGDGAEVLLGTPYDSCSSFLGAVCLDPMSELSMFFASIIVVLHKAFSGFAGYVLCIDCAESAHLNFSSL